MAAKVDAPSVVMETVADIRVSLDAEIKLVRDQISEDTLPSSEMMLRARLSGLEWAMAEVIRAQIQD